MPLLMYMKIDGVPGNSKDFQHKGWFDVLSWNWGMTSNRKAPKCEDSDKTSLNELSVIKSVGSDSAAIRSLFAKGAVIPSIEFSIIPEVGKREVKTKYVNMKMENVIIKSIISGGNMEENFFKEHITFLFEKIWTEYTRNTARSAEGVETEPDNQDFSWDVSENTEWIRN